MKRNLFPILVLASLTAAYAMMVFASAPQLPARAAMHFGAGGQANGWAKRDQATLFFEIMAAVPLIFLILAQTIKIMPAGAFNLPHRDYWLAPERRAETVAVISRMVLWMGCLMVLFLAGIFWLTVAANRFTPAHLPMNWFVLLLAGFLGATAIWTVLFLRRFYKIPPTAPL